MERLPQLNYSLLKESALRKKLSELGIPHVGPKTLLIRRHTEWVDLVNANCDSLKPRSKRELLHELDLWDKTQGRLISNGLNSTGGASSVMNKEFDGRAWASSHNDDFQALIARARKRPNPRAEVGDSSDEVDPPAPSNHEEHVRYLHEPRTDAQSKLVSAMILPNSQDRRIQVPLIDLEADA